jgi:hypothetical protein
VSSLLVQNAVASLPSSNCGGESSIPPAAAASAAASAPATAARREETQPAPPIGTADEYPQTVQELVMNGFELRKVVRAWELIGDNFDDLLSFLVSNAS